MPTRTNKCEEPTVHVVTKILLVFCAVLSLLLAALTMSYAANASAIRDGYKSMELEKIAAEAARNDLQSQWDQNQAETTAKVQAAAADALRFQNEARAIEAQRTELRTQLEQAKAAATAVANQIVELGGTVSTQADVIKVYREEVTKLRDDMVKLARREAELLDKINDLEGQREVLDQNTRALQEQLKEAQLALQTAQNPSQGAGTGDQPFEHVGTPIYAHVVKIDQSPDGVSQLVTISEGSNRGIQKNMLMNVKRGDKFLGKLVILSVDPNSSVGRLDTLGKDVTVQVSDEVVSTLLK